MPRCIPTVDPDPTALTPEEIAADVWGMCEHPNRDECNCFYCILKAQVEAACDEAYNQAVAKAASIADDSKAFIAGRKIREMEQGA